MGFQLGQKTVAVFSHPNHEIAVLATLRRLGARTVFLTDGGGPHRVEETRKGLRLAGLEAGATFLPHTEQSFYDALLQLDVEFLKKVVEQLREVFRREKPEQILCDAVEFYNPVHDLTLAIVGAADDAPWQGTFEVPLVYQKPGLPESYGVQTAPDAFGRIEMGLTEHERELKKSALQGTYTILRDTLGALILASPRASQRETLLPAKTPIRFPDAGRVLRYEKRAASLKREGKVDSEITHAFHYLPLVSALLGAPRS